MQEGLKSRPARGAWIETPGVAPRTAALCSRAPHGARGLNRAPHGARGLKPLARVTGAWGRGSRPARGAWIETRPSRSLPSAQRVAPRTGRVD